MRFPWFGRKAKAEAAEEVWEAELRAQLRRERELAEAGWYPFINPSPGSPSPFGLLIYVIDPDGSIWTTPYDKMHPQMNVAGRFWRPSVFAESSNTIEGALVPAITLH